MGHRPLEGREILCAAEAHVRGRRIVGRYGRGDEDGSDRDDDQRKHEELLAPLTSEQPPGPMQHRPTRGDATTLTRALQARRASLDRRHGCGATCGEGCRNRRRRGRADDAPVAQKNDPVRERRQVRVVGNEDRRYPLLAAGDEHAHHRFAVRLVECP